MTLTLFSPDEATAAITSARERAHRRINEGPRDLVYEVRMALLERNDGFGYLRHELSTLETLDRGLLSLLAFAGIERMWQLCARKRSELEALEGAAWDRPLFDNDELDQIEAFLTVFDLSLVPE